MCLCFHVKCLLFLSDINQNGDMSTDFSNTPQCQISGKSIWGEPSHWRGQAGRHEANSRYSFSAPKTEGCLCLLLS